MGKQTFGTRLRVKTINMSHWVRRGNMLISRESLNGDDPDHPYNWIKTNFPGVDPCDFGICKPPPIYKFEMLNWS